MMLCSLTKSILSKPAGRRLVLPLSSISSTPAPFQHLASPTLPSPPTSKSAFSSSSKDPPPPTSPPPSTQTIFAVNDDTITEEEISALIDSEIAKHEAEEARKLNPDWKPGYRRRPLQISYSLDDFENEHRPDHWVAHLNRRCGGLAIKLGMMPVWDEWGARHACTVLMMDSNVVLRTFTEEKDGYYGVQLGAGARKRKNVNKPTMGHYMKYLPHLRVHDGDDTHPSLLPHPPYLVREFRLTHKDYLPEPGSRIHARHFVPGQNIDISAISKGKGFQGAMKRWNFSGMPASHGTSLSHRSLGSTGQCQDPGRVFKGKKMAGRMGGNRVTVQNSRIVKIDRGRDLIYVRGAVPGQKGNFVEIRDAIKRPLFATDKVEDQVRFPPLPTFDYDEAIDGCGEGGFDAFMPMTGQDPINPAQSQAA